jgi:hypothetical protein
MDDAIGKILLHQKNFVYGFVIRSSNFIDIGDKGVLGISTNLRLMYVTCKSNCFLPSQNFAYLLQNL